MVGVLMIIFPPFVSAAMMLIGCFEVSTGRSFQEIESWFGTLSWWRKCLIAPALAAPLAILAYGLIWYGSIGVRLFLTR